MNPAINVNARCLWPGTGLATREGESFGEAHRRAVAVWTAFEDAVMVELDNDAGLLAESINDRLKADPWFARWHVADAVARDRVMLQGVRELSEKAIVASELAPDAPRQGRSYIAPELRREKSASATVAPASELKGNHHE
jgi:hypothetical protein